MSEEAPTPNPAQFPDLPSDHSWCSTIAAGTMFARVFHTAGPYPSDWNAYRSYGPVDSRFDPHPNPPQEHAGYGVMYTVPELSAQPRRQGNTAGETIEGDAAMSTLATCLIECFQRKRVITRELNTPALAFFSVTRELTLLNLSDSDWLTVAGGNAAVMSGSRERSREWSRAIAHRYPDIDGVLSASSLMPHTRISALWQRSQDALPAHPDALLTLDRPELTGIIEATAARYGYAVL